ncbi:MAG: kelch repeatcontaining protein [Phycisphaerales bacterium]|nr:kelch repeatcontaining protein [Phycisphaerales bacterium]
MFTNRSPKRRASQVVEQLESRLFLSATVQSATPTSPTVGLIHTTARLSTPRLSVAAVTVGTKAIFAGSQSEPEKTVDLYDSVTRQWSTASLSQGRWWMGVTVVDGNAIFAGGTTAVNFGYPPPDPSSVVDIYDSTTNRWSTAALSLARYQIVAATAGHKALFAGGVTPTDPVNNVVDIYDADTGHWSTAALSQARGGFAAATVGKLALFAGGGLTDSNGAVVLSNVVDIYDGASGQWSTATLSQARSDMSAVTVGSKVVFAGDTDVIDIYDSATGQWTTARLSQARIFMASTAVDGQAVFAGGLFLDPSSGANYSPSDVVDVYDANTGQVASGMLSYAGGEFTATTLGDKAIIAGANLGGGIASDAVNVYDAATRNWSTTTLARARNSIGAATLGNQAFFAGGAPEDVTFSTSLVDVFTLDPTAPTTTLANASTRKRARDRYTFTVSYHDDFGIDTDTLDDNDIIVNGPNGYELNARFVSLERGKHGSTRIATYAILSRGARWDPSDDGIYTIHLQDGQVTDLANNPAIGRRIGTLTVAIPAVPSALAAAAVQRGMTVFQSKRKINELLEG